MKTVIAVALMIVSTLSFGASVKVYEAGQYVSSIDGSFGINEELGRAWVELSIYDNFSSDSGPSYDRVLVPGLSIVGGQVVLDVQGQQVVCANIKPVGIFRYRLAKATGNCKFVTTIEKRSEDTGFEIRKYSVKVLSIVTK